METKFKKGDRVRDRMTVNGTPARAEFVVYDAAFDASGQEMLLLVGTPRGWFDASIFEVVK